MYDDIEDDILSMEFNELDICYCGLTPDEWDEDCFNYEKHEAEFND